MVGSATPWSHMSSIIVWTLLVAVNVTEIGTRETATESGMARPFRIHFRFCSPYSFKTRTPDAVSSNTSVGPP
jgi:hypothetical protein